MTQDIEWGPAIDWTKPIERYDGTPMKLYTPVICGGTNPDNEGHYWVRPEDGSGYGECIGTNGFDISPDRRVRNRPLPADDTVVGRPAPGSLLERNGVLWEVIGHDPKGSGFEVRKVGTRFEDINQWHLNFGSEHAAEWKPAQDVEGKLLAMIREWAMEKGR